MRKKVRRIFGTYPENISPKIVLYFIFTIWIKYRTAGIIKRSMTDANREQSSGLRHYQDSYLKSMKERISIDESIAIRPTCRSPLPCYHRDDITTRCLFQWSTLTDWIICMARHSSFFGFRSYQEYIQLIQDLSLRCAWITPGFAIIKLLRGGISDNRNSPPGVRMPDGHWFLRD